jgi:hypothetical protein
LCEREEADAQGKSQIWDVDVFAERGDDPKEEIQILEGTKVSKVEEQA